VRKVIGNWQRGCGGDQRVWNGNVECDAGFRCAFVLPARCEARGGDHIEIGWVGSLRRRELRHYRTDGIVVRLSDGGGEGGDSVELFGTGFGSTNSAVPAGQTFSGAAATTSPVGLQINNLSVLPSFAGLSGAGLYQINVTVPAGLGTGDVALQASVAGVQTPSGVVISLQ
jgi:hypothetical protein